MISPQQQFKTQDALLAGAVAGSLAGLAAGWVANYALGQPAAGAADLIYKLYIINSTHQSLPWQLNAAGLFIISSAIAAGIPAGWLAGQPQREKIHESGGRLIESPKKIKTQEKDILFNFAGLDFSRDRIRRSIFLTGSIGGGKTVATLSIIKNLMISGHRLLIIDGPKGDYSREMPVPAGQRVAVIAPWLDSLVWDVAADVSTPQHARELARALIPISEKDPLWGNAAGMILTAVIIKLQSEKPGSWSWKDLSDEAFQPIENLKKIAEVYYPPAVQAVSDAESKTTQSIAINLTAFLADVYELGQSWGDSPQDKRISFNRWWRGEYSVNTIVLQGSAEFSGIASAYIGGIVKYLANLTSSPSFEESKTRKNVIVVDEFAQLGRLDKIEKFLEIGRSKGCSLVSATQAFAQIREIYGQNQLSAWLSMIGTKVFLRTLGADEQEMIVREAGTRRIKKLSTTVSNVDAGSRGAGDQTTSRSWQEAEEPVLLKSDLSELGPDARGVTMLIAGFGSDIIRSRVNFSDLPPKINRTFIKNERFNRMPLAASAASVNEVESVNTQDQVFTESLVNAQESITETVSSETQDVYETEQENASTPEPASVTAVNDFFEDFASQENAGLQNQDENAQEQELASDLIVYRDVNVTEQETASTQENAGDSDEINPAAEQIIESVATDVISQAIGVDHHIIDAVLNLEDSFQDTFKANNDGAYGVMSVAAVVESDEITMNSSLNHQRKKLKLKRKEQELHA